MTFILFLLKSLALVVIFFLACATIQEGTRWLLNGCKKPPEHEGPFKKHWPDNSDI